MRLSESEERKREETNGEDGSVSVLSIKVHDGEQEEWKSAGEKETVRSPGIFPGM